MLAVALGVLFVLAVAMYQCETTGLSISNQVTSHNREQSGAVGDIELCKNVVSLICRLPKQGSTKHAPATAK